VVEGSRHRSNCTISPNLGSPALGRMIPYVSSCVHNGHRECIRGPPVRLEREGASFFSSVGAYGQCRNQRCWERGSSRSGNPQEALRILRRSGRGHWADTTHSSWVLEVVSCDSVRHLRTGPRRAGAYGYGALTSNPPQDIHTWRERKEGRYGAQEVIKRLREMAVVELGPTPRIRARAAWARAR